MGRYLSAEPTLTPLLSRSISAYNFSLTVSAFLPRTPLAKFSILFAYLYYLNIPNTVERIENYAIYDSSITIFEINENVTIAEYDAFYMSRINGN